MLGDSCRVDAKLPPSPRFTLWVDPKLWSIDCSLVSAVWIYPYVSTVSQLWKNYLSVTPSHAVGRLGVQTWCSIFDSVGVALRYYDLLYLLGDSCRVNAKLPPFPRVTLGVDPRLLSVDCSAVSAMWKYSYVSTVLQLWKGYLFVTPSHAMG